MAKAKVRFDGIEEFIKVLDQVPREITQKGQTAALWKAAKPIEDKARGYVKSWARGTDKDGFSKMLLLAQRVKRTRYKGGVNVQIKTGTGTDIPVKGLKQREAFSSFGWARLVAQGRQWTAKTSTSRMRYNTGKTQGKGDFIDMAFNKEARRSQAIYKKLRIPMIQKAFNRSIKKYGLRS
jgi:hypothetical protein